MKPKKNKTLQLNADIQEHDLNTKINKAKKWLDKGARIYIEMRFKGREAQRREPGLETFNKTVKALMNHGAVINSPIKDEIKSIRIILESKENGKNK